MNARRSKITRRIIAPAVAAATSRASVAPLVTDKSESNGRKPTYKTNGKIIGCRNARYAQTGSIAITIAGKGDAVKPLCERTTTKNATRTYNASPTIARVFGPENRFFFRKSGVTTSTGG